MWNRRAGLILLLLAAACETAAERPGAVLRREYPAVAVQRLGAYEEFYADYSDRAVLNALYRILRIGIAKDRIEKVVLTAHYGPPFSVFHEPDGRPDAYHLWLRISGCDRQIYMAANFNSRVVSVSDKSGCLKQAARSAIQ